MQQPMPDWPTLRMLVAQRRLDRLWPVQLEQLQGRSSLRGTWTGPNGRRTEFGDCSFGTAWDSYAGAGTRFKPTVRNGLRAEFDGVGAVGRASVGAVGHLRSTSAVYEHVTRDDYGTRAKTA